MRIAYWDLETTNLKGDIGRLLIGSILTHAGDLLTFRQDKIRRKKDFSDDAPLAVKIRDTLEDHDLIVAWNGKGFDIPFLNTRLIQGGERRLATRLVLDPMWYVKGWRGLMPRNGKLSTAIEFFGLDESKMAVPVEIWAKAAGGNREALDVLTERCESDVRTLAEVTRKILASGVVKTIQAYP